MKPTFIALLVCCLAFVSHPAGAASAKWTGVRSPVKASAEDGVTKLGIKIGKFIPLENEAEWANVIANVHGKFPGSRPWVTLGVGEVPEAPAATAEQQEKALDALERLGVDVYLELWPRKTTDVLAAIDTWLGKYKARASVKGVSIDLEFYKGAGATDDEARAWDERIKSHGAGYRMILKHWDQKNMPKTYRGKGDIIFVNTSSEADVAALNAEYVKWAAHYAPSAVAFQIGYPADEDGMDGSKEKGWWTLKDPIKDWGDALLAKIPDSSQEIGLIWICVKSGKTYNQGWDLTKPAKAK